MDTIPAMIEALAIRWSLKLVLDLKNILVFSDAFPMVDCNNGLDFSAELEPIILDCLSFYNSFKDCNYFYLTRAFNMRAHSLVGLGHEVGSKTWLGHFPFDKEFPLLDHHDPFFS